MQFNTILNKIFSSSEVPLNDSQINDIYNAVCNKDDNLFYFNESLSANNYNDIFTDKMHDILKEDSLTISILHSTPNLSSNNPNNSTLQQILHDQVYIMCLSVYKTKHICIPFTW